MSSWANTAFCIKPIQCRSMNKPVSIPTHMPSDAIDAAMSSTSNKLFSISKKVKKQKPRARPTIALPDERGGWVVVAPPPLTPDTLMCELGRDLGCDLVVLPDRAVMPAVYRFVVGGEVMVRRWVTSDHDVTNARIGIHNPTDVICAAVVLPDSISYFVQTLAGALSFEIHDCLSK